MVAVLLFCAVLVLPTATTGAFWISNRPAPATTAGRWCSVPNHELKPNPNCTTSAVGPGATVLLNVLYDCQNLPGCFRACRGRSIHRPEGRRSAR